jgi:hypothetical protein
MLKQLEQGDPGRRLYRASRREALMELKYQCLNDAPAAGRYVPILRLLRPGRQQK